MAYKPRNPKKLTRRTPAPRPLAVSEAKLPRQRVKVPKPDICSRCGNPGVRYICKRCKVALTLAARRRREAQDPGAIEQRRKYRREWMRKKRGESPSEVKQTNGKIWTD